MSECCWLGQMKFAMASEKNFGTRREVRAPSDGKKATLWVQTKEYQKEHCAPTGLLKAECAAKCEQEKREKKASEGGRAVMTPDPT